MTQLNGAVLAAAALAIGCSESVAPIDRPDATVVADSGAPIADAGEADAGAQDAEPADSGTVRRLVERRLLGESPVDNLIEDPVFDLATFSWFAVGLDGTFLQLHRLVPTETPSGLAVLAVPRQPVNPLGQLALFGSVRASGAPLEASIFLGRPARAASSTPTVSLIGLGADGTALAFDLAPDRASVRRMGEIDWVRFTARLDRQALGWLSLVIGDSSDTTLYVTGAVVTEATRARHLARAERSEPRPVTDVERRLLRKFREKLNERLATPSRPARRFPPVP